MHKFRKQVQPVDWNNKPIHEDLNYNVNPCVRRYGYGPEDKKCKDCAHIVRFYAARSYYKCRKYPGKLTHGSKTDQKTNWQSCAEFEQRTGDIPLYDGRG